MFQTLLKRLKPSDIPAIRRDPVDPKARLVAEPIVEAVKLEGEAAVRRYAEQFGEIAPGAQIAYTAAQLREAFENLDAEQTKRVMLDNVLELNTPQPL